MTIGHWGQAVFMSNGKGRIMSYAERTSKASARWAKLEVIGGKPLVEFNGGDLREEEFTIYLAQGIGPEPETVFGALVEMIENGEHHYMVFGSRPYGLGEWAGVSVEAARTEHEPITGKTTWMELTLVCQEYR